MYLEYCDKDLGLLVFRDSGSFRPCIPVQGKCLTFKTVLKLLGLAFYSTRPTEHFPPFLSSTLDVTVFLCIVI